MVDQQTLKGYLGNTLLKKSNQQIEWSQNLVEEYVKCSQDPIYFTEKYMKIINIDKGLINFKLYQYQKNMLLSMQHNRFNIIATARQAGKALPLDTPISTPTGFKNMGELRPGDYVIDENGKPTKVTLISETFLNHDCFKITFDDGSSIVSDAEHLWVVNVRDNKHKQITLTAQQLFDSKYNRATASGHTTHRYYIPNCKPIEYTTQKIDIDPYTLGVWLGDGTSASGSITCTFEDIIEYKQHIPYDFGKSFSSNKDLYTGTLYALQPSLRKYNLLNDKHIPDEYLFNNVETRIELLRGIMDTDGWVDRRGSQHIQLSNKYSALLEDVYTLLCGLGCKVFRKYFKKTNSTRFSFAISREQFDTFKLSQKKNKQIQTLAKAKYCNSRSIVNVERVDSVPTKCIMVENPTHLFLCGQQCVPTHNTTVTCAFILWYIIFHAEKTVALLANKGETAREILGRVQLAYQHLPKWLQQGVKEWNKGSFELENNSRVIAAATASDAIRGYSINLLFIDEAAFIENWDEFFTSVYPTISSGQDSKVVLVSTPNGLNHFYAIWKNALEKKNNYSPIEVKWQDVPGRTEEWRVATLASMNNDQEKFEQEYCVEFMGSSGTLIAGWKLKELVYQTPLHSHDGLNQYYQPVKNRSYVIVVDTSRGKGLDYCAFQCIDISEMPYKQVATFRNNMITPTDYVGIVYQVAKAYNGATVLVEINDIGEQIPSLLINDYEYDNILYTENAGKQGKRITQKAGRLIDKGIRTTKVVKSVGCSMLKLLVEQNQLIIVDLDTVMELSTFSRSGNSYEAEEGKNDDLVMCLVLFGWLTSQEYFKNLSNINTLNLLRDKSDEEIVDELSPFGFVDDGQTDMEPQNPEFPDTDRWFDIHYGKI
jgi:hypothetical protein